MARHSALLMARHLAYLMARHLARLKDVLMARPMVRNLALLIEEVKADQTAWHWVFLLVIRLAFLLDS